MTHNKLILVFLILAGWTLTAEVQDSPHRRQNGVFFELGGNGLLCSLNYERRFSYNLVLRLGGFHYGKQNWSSLLTCSKLFGSERNSLELGLGITLINFDHLWGAEMENISCLTGIVALRIRPRHGPFFLRIGLTPFFFTDDARIVPWVGISLGFSF